MKRAPQRNRRQNGAMTRLEAEAQALRARLARERDEREGLQRDWSKNALALELSRERFAELYDSAPVSLLTLNRSGFICGANLTAAQMLGVQRELLLDSLLSQFVVKEDRRALLHHLFRCRRGTDREPIASELRMTTAGGQRLYVELVSRRATGNHDQQIRFLTALRDITARKQAEAQLKEAFDRLEERVVERTQELRRAYKTLQDEMSEHRRTGRALKESEERWRLMLEGAGGYAIFMLDPRGRVVTWSPAAQHIKGWSAKEIIGQHFSRFYTVRDIRRKLPERLLKVAKTEGRVEAEGWRVRKDKSRYWANVTITALRDPEGRLRGFLKIVHDATARMQAQAALVGSEHRLTDFFERSPIGLLWAGPDERIQRANQAWLDLAGCSCREDCLNHRLSEFFLDPRTATHLLEQLQQQKVVRDRRAHVRGLDGLLRSVLVDADGLWENRRLVHVRCFIRDITRRVQLEREVLRAAEAEQGRIGRDLHDDLCQQLAGIEFLSQTLAGALARRQPAEASQAREIAGMVREAITRTRGLARGLSPVQLETMGLPGALQDLSRNSRKLFGVHCRFHCRKLILNHGEAVSVHLYRIAQEAVGNAVKHGKAKHVDISMKSDNGQVMLSVKDDGVGIPDLARKRQGMGLRVMQYRADVIGGTLLVQRNRKGGTSVVCTVKNSDEKTKPGQSV